MELPLLQLQKKTSVPDDVMQTIRSFVPTRPSRPHPVARIFERSMIWEGDGEVRLGTYCTWQTPCTTCGVAYIWCRARWWYIVEGSVQLRWRLKRVHPYDWERSSSDQCPHSQSHCLYIYKKGLIRSRLDPEWRL